MSEIFRVLIVDDSRSIHAFIKAQLCEIENCQFYSAFNGHEALEILQKNTEISVVFLDWEMPILNGLDTMIKIRDMALGCAVIIVTSKNNPEEIQLMLQSGANEFIMKPFTKDILISKIEMVLGARLLRVA